MTKEQSTTTICHFSSAVCLCLVLFACSAEIHAQDAVEEQAATAPAEKDYTFLEAVVESVTGDVYSDEAAARWQELSYSNMFSKGWDKPWSSPPNGGGGAPRQGWLNAYDGVFYRLSIATFGW